MDPTIDLGSMRVRLSAIRHDHRSRTRYLRAHHSSGAPVRCLCTSSPIEMGIAARGRPDPTYYLYALRRTDPPLHHPQCPHRIEDPLDHQPVVPAEQSQPAASPAPDPVDPLRLDASFLAPSSIESPLAFPMTPLAVALDRLLVAAGLNTWHPSFASKRSYFHARFRLIEAAKTLKISPTQSLADRFHFPPPWDPSRKDDIEYQEREFVDQLQPGSDGFLPRGLVIGRVRNFEQRPSWTASLLQLSGSKQNYWLDAAPTFFIPPLPPEISALVMLVVDRPGPSTRLRVVDAAFHLLTPHWIPVASVAHATLAEGLITRGDSFVASMRADPVTHSSYPDFLVQGSDPLNPARVSPRSIPAPSPSNHRSATSAASTSG